MANVQTSDGVVRNLPDQSSAGRQQISASPEAFGAGVAQAKMRTGQVLQQIGDEGFKLGEHFSRVQVDDQTTRFMTDANKGLDEYRNLQGAERLTKRGEIEKRIEDAATQYRSTLKLPMQQQEFDRQVRNFRQSYLTAQFSQLSAQADRTYKTEVAKSKFQTSVQLAALAPGNPVAIEHARDTARHAMVNLLEAEGNADDEQLYNEAIASADRAVDKSIVESIGVTNPKAALEYADKAKASLGHEYVPLANGLRVRLQQQDEDDITNQVFASVGRELTNPEAPKTSSSSGIRQALYDQEGGPVTNPTQIQKGTWEQWKKEGLVHEGETFGDPESMQAVGDRAIAKYEQQFRKPDGSPDPERVAVAWFSGPGNVSPPDAAQPFLEDRQDENKKTVSSYVSDIRGRMGGPKGAMYAAQASVYDRALQLTEGKPAAVRKGVLAQVQSRFSAARTAALQSEAATKAQTDAAIREYGDAVRKGLAGQPWRNDPRLSEAQVRDMDDYQQKRLAAAVNGEPGDFGAGYDKVRQRIMGSGSDRILHEEQLLPLLRSGDINVAGYDAAGKLLDRFKKPGAVGARMQEEAFWNSTKKAVTQEFEFEGKSLPVTPERLKAWSSAIPVLTHAIENGRAQGIPDDELFDPDGKRSAWRALGKPGGPFLPTSQEEKNARLKAALAADKTTGEKKPGGPKPWQEIKTREEAQEAWRAGDLSPEDARRLWNERKWGQPANVIPTVPNGK